MLAALALAVGFSTAPAADGQVACHITSADAFFYSDTPQVEGVTYYATVIMYTDECGVSPAEVQATFRPVTGTPSTCDFRGTLLSEYALCQGARGLVAPGTSPAVGWAIRRRIATYQGLYTLGLVIAIIVGTIPGIVFVVLVQLNAAIAPRLPILWRL